MRPERESTYAYALACTYTVEQTVHAGHRSRSLGFLESSRLSSMSRKVAVVLQAPTEVAGLPHFRP